MRDREYDKTPPPGTLRMALVGASVSMGTGVADMETYENVLEDRLNREGGTDGYERYEILNFSVDGFEPLRKLHMLETRAVNFEPAIALYVAHSEEFDWVTRGLYKAIQQGIEIPWEYPARIAREAGIEASHGEMEAQTRLAPYADELLRWTYERFVETCRERGIRAYMLFLPRMNEAREPHTPRALRVLQSARDAGFSVLDVSDTFRDVRRLISIRLAAWDRHPNAAGYELLADALYDAMTVELADFEPQGAPE